MSRRREGRSYDHFASSRNAPRTIECFSPDRCLNFDICRANSSVIAKVASFNISVIVYTHAPPCPSPKVVVIIVTRLCCRVAFAGVPGLGCKRCLAARHKQNKQCCAGNHASASCYKVWIHNYILNGKPRYRPCLLAFPCDLYRQCVLAGIPHSKDCLSFC